MKLMGFPRVNTYQIHLMCKHSLAVGAGSTLALNYSLLGGEIFQNFTILQIFQSGKSIIPNKCTSYCCKLSTCSLSGTYFLPVGIQCCYGIG